MDWLQKGLWYGSAKLDSRLSDILYIFWQSHKIHRRSHEKLESGIYNEGENSERHLSRRCTLVISICNGNDATQFHNLKCTVGYKFTKSQKRINHLIYIDDIKLFAKKWKRTGDSDTNNKNRQPGYGMKFGLEKCAKFIMQREKREITEGIELLNQEGTRSLWEKEPYKYLAILEADTIKQVEKKYINCLKAGEYFQKNRKYVSR